MIWSKALKLKIASIKQRFHLVYARVPLRCEHAILFVTRVLLYRKETIPRVLERARYHSVPFRPRKL